MIAQRIEQEPADPPSARPREDAGHWLVHGVLHDGGDLREPPAPFRLIGAGALRALAEPVADSETPGRVRRLSKDVVGDAEYMPLPGDTLFSGPGAISAALDRMGPHLVAELADRAGCVEIKMLLWDPAPEPGGGAGAARVGSTIAQRLGDIADRCCVTPAALRAPVRGEVRMALSLMLDRADLPALDEALTEAEGLAAAHGLRICISSPSRPESFPGPRLPATSVDPLR